MNKKPVKEYKKPGIFGKLISKITKPLRPDPVGRVPSDGDWGGEIEEPVIPEKPVVPLGIPAIPHTDDPDDGEIIEMAGDVCCQVDERDDEE